MSVIDWLLDGDPAIRWQVLRDLGNAPADDVAAERARVENDGWAARLLALELVGRRRPEPPVIMVVERAARQAGVLAKSG
jgi:hypothetical protein